MLKGKQDLEEIPTWTCVVALALRDRDERWLMHRRPQGKDHAGKWEYPGGKVEAGETPSAALVREIAEELGYVLDPASLRPSVFAASPPDQPDRQIVILLYTATWDRTPMTSREGGATGWFTAAEIATLDRPPLDVALSLGLFQKAT